MTRTPQPAVWFPAVRTGTGTDVFTERLVAGLTKRGIRAEILWLPLRAEYAPWTVRVPEPPAWATVAHVNTWLHQRFLPKHLPVVATLHHSVHDPALDPSKGFAQRVYHRYWIRHVERCTMGRADVVVAVSHFAAGMARRYVLDRPMRVIYNGVDTERFRRPDGAHTPHSPFRLLYVGSWKALKGVDLLTRIMRELAAGFELLYTGGAASKCDKRLMPPNMHDIGRLKGEDAVVAAMQDADAFLFPSRSEGFGLVAVEAMACGLPVIATRGSSLTEVVAENQTGILCPLDDVAAFVAAVREVSSNPARYRAMREAARHSVVARLSLANTVSAYINVYRTFV